MASPAYPLEPLTVSEWMERASAEGWRRAELEDGKVVELAPIYGLHGSTVARVTHLLVLRFGLDRVASATIELDEYTAYDPDALVLREGRQFEDLSAVPAGDCLVVVEVSVSSAERDLLRKAQRYGRSGVPEYWVVQPESKLGILHRHTGPTPRGYQRVERFEVGHRAGQLDLDAILGST